MVHDRRVVEDKSTLRARIRAQRAARPADAGRAAAEGLLAVLRGAGLLDPAGRADVVGPVRLAAYLAGRGEPDPGLACAAVREAGGSVLVPVPLPGRLLGWAHDDGRSALHPRLPIPVPLAEPVGVGAQALVAAGVTVVLVPALAVDGSGTRLGQGGGFYDRLLAELPVRIAVVAVVHDDELLPPGRLPREAHDRVVPRAVTPTRLVRLGDAPAR